jgi:hypothetical protein
MGYKRKSWYKPKGSKKFHWPFYAHFVKKLPVPCRAEQVKIKASLCLDADHPFPRCGAKDMKKVKAFEKAGDFSHSGGRREHICDKCRCTRVGGYGTKHYGVGYCYYHDYDKHRRVAKTMAIALQQGYPLAPLKYQSESEYIESIRKMAEQANGRLDLSEEIILLRSHLQEVEALWKDDKEKKLTMKVGMGVAPMSDDVKIGLLVKLTEAISKLSTDTYRITESDYVHVDEIKTWLWSIWQCVTKNIQKMIVGELNPNNLQEAIQAEFKLIPLPKVGRRNTK